MNRLFSTFPLIVLFLGLCSGCSPNHTVILTPSPDGHVGKAEVRTDGGKQLLEAPNAMTTVSGTDAPSSVTTASPEFITARFSEVLAVEPLPAEKFIIYFNSNTSEVTSDSRATISKILDTIKQRKAISIKISGHTDATGSAQLNEKLSCSRARSIKELLIRQGADAAIMEVSSHGKGNQLIPTADGIAEPRNRRVEVIVR